MELTDTALLLHNASFEDKAAKQHHQSQCAETHDEEVEEDETESLRWKRFSVHDYCRESNRQKLKKLLEDDDRISVYTGINVAMEQDDHALVTIMLEHVRRKEDLLVNEFGKEHAHLKIKNSLRSKMVSDDIQWCDLTADIKKLMSDYVSHTYTTASEQKECLLFLEEMETRMDSYFDVMAGIGFPESIQRLIWDYCAASADDV